MSLIDDFMAAFDVWGEARPYIHMMAREDEMRLVVAMGGRAMTPAQVGELFDLSSDEAAQWLHACYQRHIVDKTEIEGELAYSPGTFYTRLDHFAKYDSQWDDIPADDRARMNQGFLNAFIEKHRPNVERKKRGLTAENALPNDTILLLHEVEEMIQAAEAIVVQPCDCRRLGQNCERPVETCIWLDDGARAALDRGYGRELTREEAVEVIRWADRKGLMHTADSEWRTRGLHAICNCCACDCYPFRAAQELDSKGVWPKSRYVATFDPAPCNHCGACTRRCHFDAFYFDGTTIEVEGKTRKTVRFDPDLCWGCGLCANTCPRDAIAMLPLEA
jgi:NAD-dependent dihydropyrimidine dehydrogenase PreA subunit